MAKGETKTVVWTITNAQVVKGSGNLIATIGGDKSVITRDDMTAPLKAKAFEFTKALQAKGYKVDSSDFASKGVVRITGTIAKGGRDSKFAKAADSADALAILNALK